MPKKRQKRIQKSKQEKNRKLIIYVLIIVFVCLAVFLLSRNDFSKGLKFLEERAGLNISKIEEKLDEARKKEFADSVNNGETSIFAGYKDSVLMGDSRVVGFSTYHYVPDNQVFAVAGGTLEDISNWVEDIGRIKPKYIYISFGVNDMGLEIGKDKGEDGYAQVLKEQVGKLLEVSPNSKIIVNSIIDATPEAVAKSPAWSKVGEYNAQLKKACEEMNWYYVDNSALSNQGTAPIYQPDGVHFTDSFYYEWAANMLKSQYPDLQI